MKRLELLDYGRFFATIIVIAFHYTFNGIANGKITSINHISSVIQITKYGYLGVELFFMISGYVIFFSAKTRSASNFAVSRAVRLYPTYWFAILFTSFFALMWGKGGSMSVYPTQIIVNFSMVQSFFGIGHIDGVYWTLVYEITFYFSVFLLLFLGLQRYLNTIFIYWPVLFCIGIIFGVQSVPYFGGYYYYFSAGALFAILSNKFSYKAFISLATTYALCVDFSSSKAVHLSQSKGIYYSSLVIGIIITSFFILFSYQNTKKGRSLQLPLSKLAGSITYPVYLIHAHFGYMFLSQFATDNNKLIFYIITVLIVFSVAIFIHLVIEKRLSHFWKNIFWNTIGKPLNHAQEVPRILKMGFLSRICG